MSEDKTKGPEVTAAWLQANHPAVYSEVHKAGEDNAIATLGPDHEAKGANDERRRIQAVLDQSMPGHEALVQTLAFDGKTTAEQAAVQVLAAEKQVLAQARENLRTEEPPPVKAASSAMGDHQAAEADPNLPIEERCKAQWDKDASLRAEFGELETYIAYARAESEGKVRKLGGKSK